MALTAKEQQRFDELVAEIDRLKKERAVELLPKFKSDLADAERRIALYQKRLDKAYADEKKAKAEIADCETFVDADQTDLLENDND